MWNKKHGRGHVLEKMFLLKKLKRRSTFHQIVSNVTFSGRYIKASERRCKTLWAFSAAKKTGKEYA